MNAPDDRKAAADARPAGLSLDDVVRLTGGVVEPLVEEARGGLADDGRAAGRDARVRHVATLDDADGDAVAFYADARYADAFARTRAGVVLVKPELARVGGAARAARVLVDDPHAAMLTLLPALYPPAARSPGIHPTSLIGRGVTLGAGVRIDAGAAVGDGATIGDGAWVGGHVEVGERCVIGEHAELRPHVTLYADTRVGRRVIVHSGARLGSDGFGYVFRGGAHRKVPHVGRCVVEDDVEIGANTTIDRGSVGDTVIGAGTKIDNLVHIAHNVRIGRLCLIMAQAGIAGSAVVEDGVILAGQVGVAGHVTIGRGARVAAQAGVVGNMPAGETWGGYPARPHRESMRAHAVMFRLLPLIRPLERLLAGAPNEVPGRTPNDARELPA